MSKKILLAGAMLAVLAPAAAFAQSGAGTAAGATTGAVGGAIVGGPVGAVVGGVTGAIVGGIAEQQRPQFREYIVNQHVPSYTYREDLRVGATFLGQHVERDADFHDAPPWARALGFRYGAGTLSGLSVRWITPCSSTHR